MAGPQFLQRAGVALSMAAHAAAIAWVVFGSGVRLFDPAPAEAITVDLVTPDQAKLPGYGDGAPEEAKQDEAAQSIVPGSEQTTSDLPAPQPEPAEQPKEKPEETIQEPAKQQSAIQPNPPPAPTPPLPARAEPDITEKYGTMFSLNDSGFTPETTAAKIPQDAVSKFRAHLKTCAKLPESISPADDVRVVLRIALLRTGNLATPPALIEASASAKGPLLMQAAIQALKACQPYDMLPADKYQEWQVLDLPFTPQDFGAG